MLISVAHAATLGHGDIQIHAAAGCDVCVHGPKAVGLCTDVSGLCF